MRTNRLLFASTHSDAGKTSIIIGICKNIDKKCSYAKPMGDRLLYKKKRLWDHDSALMTRLFNLDELPELMTIGFEHTKLQYMYDDDSIEEKLNDSIRTIEANSEHLFMEGGSNLQFGSFVNLSALDIAKNTDTKVVMVVSGTHEQILDDLTYISKNIDKKLLHGVIINKVIDLDEFKSNFIEHIDSLGLKIFGIIPYDNTLETLTLRQVSEVLLAKVITCPDNLDGYIHHIDVGAMSAGRIVEKNNILTSKNNLVVTSGDRADIVLEALQRQTVGIILTNGILPEAKIISVAEQRKVPLLSVNCNTFEAVKKVDDINPLIMYRDTSKIEMIKSMIGQYVNINELITG
ncbi:MAG: AAA family ATPase [Bacteriovoracaceae bacterium]|nr:AAA family ATPase [Bacteriovoracaceae bacterium]